MKRLFLMSFALFFGVARSLSCYAEGYSYSQDRIVQGYGSAAESYYQNSNAGGRTRPANVAPASVQGYGFYQNGQAARTSSPQLMWYPTARQRAQAFGQPPYDQIGYDTRSNGGAVYRSAVYNQKTPYSKEFYMGVHAGVGNTLGWKGVLDHPIAPIFSIALGKKFARNIRGDVEFEYHARAKLADNTKNKIDYTQYDLGANVYYDFPVSSAYRPFLGVGVWGVKAKVEGKYNGRRDLDVSSSVKFALSVAAGLSYRINEAFSLIGLLRTRYIFSRDDLYNLEGLLGVQYHF